MSNIDKIKEEALDFIKKNNTAVIATVYKGEPFASAIHYVADDNWNIYFMSQRNTKKYFNISSQQKASVVIGSGPKHISIQSRGVVDMVTGKVADEVYEKIKWLKGSHIIENLPLEEMNKFKDKKPVAFKFEPLESHFMNLDDDSYPSSQGKEYWQII